MERTERTRRLVQVLERDTGPRGAFDALGRRTLAVFDTALQCRHRYGEEAIGNYIVSGAEGADDVLAPLVLARWAGATDKHTAQVGLDVAPLFESVDSLSQCGAVMRELLSEPVYRLHLNSRGRGQNILVGYSHGSRDSGFLATRLAVHDAQRDLAQVLKSNDVRRTIVHARGGSIVRGGSRIDALLRAAPAESHNGTMVLTEQGETIGQGYGLKPNAMRTLERGFASLALATQAVVSGRATMESDAQHAAAVTAATVSREAWRTLVLQDRDFYDFFRAVTPIDVIERMQIGSRTIWESLSGTAIQAVRSTPWVFAWSQARYFTPGWYGAGTGLAAARRPSTGSTRCARLMATGSSSRR